MKPGKCPASPEDSDSHSCKNDCFNDASCSGDEKCCSVGCSYTCRPPATETASTVTDSQPAFTVAPSPTGRKSFIFFKVIPFKF